MRKFLAAVVVSMSLTLPAQAVEECAPGLIHIPPMCFTEAELAQYVSTQTQTLAPTPLPVSPETLVRTIAYHFWPDWAAERMIRIAKCESNYVPTAVNTRSGAAGVWQIMPFWKKVWPGNHLDPWTNGAVAYQIWLSQGFGAWVCRG